MEKREFLPQRTRISLDVRRGRGQAPSGCHPAGSPSRDATTVASRRGEVGAP